jgi:hypothetical protein
MSPAAGYDHLQRVGAANVAVLVRFDGRRTSGGAAAPASALPCQPPTPPPVSDQLPSEDRQSREPPAVVPTPRATSCITPLQPTPFPLNGINPSGAYLTDWRMTLARDLPRSDPVTLAQIAEGVWLRVAVRLRRSISPPATRTTHHQVCAHHDDDLRRSCGCEWSRRSSVSVRDRLSVHGARARRTRSGNVRRRRCRSPASEGWVGPYC